MIIIIHAERMVNKMRREEINLLLKVFFTSCERRFLIDFVEDNQCVRACIIDGYFYGR